MQSTISHSRMRPLDLTTLASCSIMGKTAFVKSAVFNQKIGFFAVNVIVDTRTKMKLIKNRNLCKYF